MLFNCVSLIYFCEAFMVKLVNHKMASESTVTLQRAQLQ